MEVKKFCSSNDILKKKSSYKLKNVFPSHYKRWTTPEEACHSRRNTTDCKHI